MKRQAFTLVELIVVITILAILGTIAFVSYQGFSISARDSARIHDVKIIEKGLGIYETQNNTLPLPDDTITLLASGSIIGYQGNISQQVLREIKQSNKIVDPLLGDPYTYMLSSGRSSFQILAYFEKNDILSHHIFPKAHANIDYVDMFSKSFGSPLGAITYSDDQSPLQSRSISANTFELYNLSENVISHFGSETIETNDGTSIVSMISVSNPHDKILDPSLLLYYTFEDFITEEGIYKVQDMSGNNNHGFPLGNIEFVDGHAEDNTAPRSARVSTPLVINFSESDYTFIAMSYLKQNISNNPNYDVDSDPNFDADIHRPSGHAAIFGHVGGGGNEDLLLFSKSRLMFHYLSNGRSFISGGAKGGFQNNTWTHYVGRFFEGSKSQLSLNNQHGDVVDSGNFADLNIRIQAMCYSNATYCIDKIDEVRVYNRKLSDEEISVLYNLTKSRYDQ